MWAQISYLNVSKIDEGGEGGVFHMSSRGSPAAQIEKRWMGETDIIFVNFFTPAQFQDFENLPEKARKSRHLILK